MRDTAFERCHAFNVNKKSYFCAHYQKILHWTSLLSNIYKSNV